jgi:hypothetical protein
MVDQDTECLEYKVSKGMRWTSDDSMSLYISRALLLGPC